MLISNKTFLLFLSFIALFILIGEAHPFRKHQHHRHPHHKTRRTTTTTTSELPIEQTTNDSPIDENFLNSTIVNEYSTINSIIDSLNSTIINEIENTNSTIDSLKSTLINNIEELINSTISFDI
ncbi:hypothetical protein I4U23_021801 [Adineta vaga]|nr:hypothetical protein I4U23_021801 [Adineta vaga]